LYKIDIKELTHNITEHDMSKLRNNDEINGYIAHFFPYKDDGLPLVNYGLRRCIYEKGLLSHYHNNQHHPEYWVVIRDNTLSPTPMRKLYVAEMLIDWIANQSDGRLPVKEFWKMDRSRKFIHHDTIIDIDRGVDSLDDNDNDLELINTSFKLIDMSKG